MTILLMMWILFQLHAPWIIWAVFVAVAIEKLIAWVGVITALTCIKEKNYVQRR